MDLFKKCSMKMADSLDWNCKKVCKRKKGDTKRIHKRARAKLSRIDKDVIDFWNGLVEQDRRNK